MPRIPRYKLKHFPETLAARETREAKAAADLVAYLRVSTAKQEDKYGLPSQLATVTRWAEAQGRVLASIYTDSVTGDSETRNGLDNMKAAIKRGEIGEVAILDLGRLARSFRVGDDLYDELSKDVTVTSVTEGTFTDDYQSVFIRRIFQSAHEMEKAKILERLSDGLYEAVEERGRWSGGWGCFGYRSVGDGLLIIIETEAEVICLIFELLAASHSDVGIARELNARGLTTMMGLHWDHGSVKKITRRFSFYAGRSTTWLEVQSKQIAHEAILSDDLIARVDDYLTPHPDLVDSSAAAKIAGVCRNTIDRWRKAGIIEAKVVKRKHLGGNRGAASKFYYDPAQVAAVVKRQGVKLEMRRTRRAPRRWRRSAVIPRPHRLECSLFPRPPNAWGAARPPCG